MKNDLQCCYGSGFHGGEARTWNAVEHRIVYVEHVVAAETELHGVVADVEGGAVELSPRVETVAGLFGDLTVAFQVVLDNQSQRFGRFGQFVGRLFGRGFAQVHAVELQDAVAAVQPRLPEKSSSNSPIYRFSKLIYSSFFLREQFC